MMTAFTLGNARGSEGKSVPAADCRAAKSLLRSNIESRLFMLIFSTVTPIYPHLLVCDSSVDSIRALPDREPTITAIYYRAICRVLACRNEARYCPGVTPKRRAKVRRRISALLKP